MSLLFLCLFLNYNHVSLGLNNIRKIESILVKLKLEVQNGL
jgi:hypothetical protein